MAIDINPSFQRVFSNHPNIRWRWFSEPFRRRLRSLLQSRSQSGLVKLGLETEDEIKFKHFSADEIASFQNHGWLFVEDFLHESDYLKLVANWLATRWFQPLDRREVHKSYDTAFKVYVKDDVDSLVPKALQNAYRTFFSREFESQITALSGESGSMHCYWLTTNKSFWGSALAPHRDTPDIDDSGRDRRINVIFFVDSNGKGWEAGGTSILATNDFSNPIFIPMQLKNSILIYKTGAPFFHGFPPLKFGNYRHALTAHYRYPIKTISG